MRSDGARPAPSREVFATMSANDPSTVQVSPAATIPRSRRAVLGAAIGGVAAAIAGALGRPAPASAAAGSNLVIGSQANNAGTSDTQLITNSSVIAFKLLQQGPGTALMGYATAITGATRGVYGRTDSPNGFGVQARNAAAAGTGAAIQAIGVNNIGVDASTNANFSPAIRALNTGNGEAIYAEAEYGHALKAVSPGVAILAESTNGIAIWGSSDADFAAAVYGDATGEDANGVTGQSSVGAGVYGYSPGGYGVWGHTVGATGVYGDSFTGYGVRGHSSSNAGVYGSSTSSYSGYFTGALWAQSLNAAAKAFRIDHPQDPTNKALMHSCVESNERKLVYDGVVTTDQAGEATVELPSYFESLNRDLRYQLTVIGSFGQAIVKHEVAGNRFTIATSEPRTKVSWQVTGVRHDAYAKAHPLEVESVKTGREKGRYINPKEHGQPESVGVDAAMSA
jgi:hypothetical protein